MHPYIYISIHIYPFQIPQNFLPIFTYIPYIPHQTTSPSITPAVLVLTYMTGNCALLDWMIPTMMPKMPSADAKISTIRILTNRESSCASASAQALPATPTEMPDAMFVNPTLQPEKKTE